MDFIIEHATDILAIFGALVTICTTIVKLTPTTKDDEVLNKLIEVIKALSLAKK